MDKQTILITGATGNIGGGAAIALAQRGARVELLGRNIQQGQDMRTCDRWGVGKTICQYIELLGLRELVKIIISSIKKEDRTNEYQTGEN
jgi:NAD(P)-dependent dehydrogenase (short-subunit alcohol dehydrogenase family)